MPIRLKCSCGKVLSVREELAGKAVKCPGCQATIRVGGAAKPSGAAAATKGGGATKGGATKPAGTPKAKPPAKATAASPLSPATPIAGGDLDDLFNEAGFQLRTGKTCPSCFAPMAQDAVLCTACGYHLSTGGKLQAHKSDFAEEDTGEAFLKRAELDMERSKKMQEKMEKGAGLPWWLLGLILFLLASTTGVFVIAVNVSRREDATTSFNAVATLLLLAGIATAVLAIGAYAVVLYRACMESPKQGLLVLFLPPYALYYGFTRFSEAGRPLLLALVAGAASAGLFVASSAQQ